MEIKYEMIFGDEGLFDGAPEDCILAVVAPGEDKTFYLENNKSKLRGKVLVTVDGVVNLAMRSIIRTPTWTVADQKAGKLPKVGAEIIELGTERKCTVIWSDVGNEKIVVKFSTDNLQILHRNCFKPIETKEERAQREEDEWVNKAWGKTAVFARATQDERDRLRIHLRHIYRAQLSGELKMPEVQK